MKEEHEEEFKLPQPHIGVKITGALKEKKITPKQFSAMLGKQHQTGKRILGKADLHTSLLWKVSMALKHDFFQYFSASAPAENAELAKELAESKEKAAELEKAIGHMEREMEFLRKENDYLNQINRLLEEKKR